MKHETQSNPEKGAPVDSGLQRKKRFLMLALAALLVGCGFYLCYRANRSGLQLRDDCLSRLCAQGEPMYLFGECVCVQRPVSGIKTGSEPRE